MAEMQSLKELLVDELRDLYDAERQLVRALPKMAKAATSDDLRQLIESHLAETEGQVERLERAFEMLKERPRGKRCDGMAGIIEEGANLISEDFDGAVLDAGIIAGAQRVEHYEIGAYGSVMAWAKALGHTDLAELLDETLEEEKAADQKLSALAETSINEAAAAAEDNENEEDEDEDQEDSEDRTESRTSSSGARAGGRSSGGGTRQASAGGGNGSRSRNRSGGRRR